MRNDKDRLVEIIKTGHEDEISLLKENGIYSEKNSDEQNVPPPHIDESIELILGKLETAQKIDDVLSVIRKPAFELEATVPIARYYRALKKNTDVTAILSRERSTEVASYAGKNIDERGIGPIDDRIVGWRVGIVDETELPVRGTPYSGIGDAFNDARREYDEFGLRLLHPRRYLLAQLRASRKKTLLDCNHWAVLDDDSKNPDKVLCAMWEKYFGTILFRARSEGDFKGDCTFRAEFVVDVPEKKS